MCSGAAANQRQAFAEHHYACDFVGLAGYSPKPYEAFRAMTLFVVS